MRATKHTPGPWVYIGNGDIVARSEKYCGGEKDIASVFLTRNDEDEANARLIAAAPDLLEALQFITQDVCERFDMNDPSTNLGMRMAVKEARAAIAKATGEQV